MKHQYDWHVGLQLMCVLCGKMDCDEGPDQWQCPGTGAHMKIGHFGGIKPGDIVPVADIYESNWGETSSPEPERLMADAVVQKQIVIEETLRKMYGEERKHITDAAWEQMVATGTMVLDREVYEAANRHYGTFVVTVEEWDEVAQQKIVQAEVNSPCSWNDLHPNESIYILDPTWGGWMKMTTDGQMVDRGKFSDTAELNEAKAEIARLKARVRELEPEQPQPRPLYRWGRPV